MRIAFDAKRYYHNHTGLGNYSRTLVKGLLETAPETEVLLYDAKALKRTFALGAQARKDGATLYHGLSNELPFDIRRSGVPCIVTIHDVCWRTFPGMYHPIDRTLYDLKYGWAARHADCVLAISENTKRDVMHYMNVPEERIRVIYQPVGAAYYTPITEAEAKRRLAEAGMDVPGSFMLYVGSVNARKNLLGAVRAMALLPASCRMPLVVVGDGREYKKKVLEEVGRLGLGDLILWKRCSEATQLQALYTLAHLFVYPSFYEGFGLPVVEAALSGCPVLTSNVSSLPEAGGPDTLQAVPSDTEDIARKMEQGISDTTLRLSMRDGARAYAREMFSPPLLFGKLYELYEEMTDVK